MTPEEVFTWYMPGEPPAEGCWDWTGSTSGQMGYGSFMIGDVHYKAPHIAYRIYHGEIPDGVEVLHHCDRPICVHPRCLHLGTQFDNMAEMTARGRRSSGPQHAAAVSRGGRQGRRR
jgi:hypothetical protein